MLCGAINKINNNNNKIIIIKNIIPISPFDIYLVLLNEEVKEAKQSFKA